MSDFNQQIIDEFHANRGTVTTMGFGDRLVLVHSTGAKSGAPRTNPLMGIPDGDGWLIAASKGGAPDNPDWYHNLLANPAASVEVPDASADSRHRGVRRRGRGPAGQRARRGVGQVQGGLARASASTR